MFALQRYFVRNEQIVGDHVMISGDDVHHIGRVMRMNEGDRLLCCNERSETMLCEIEQISNDFVRCRIIQWIEGNVELPVHIYVASGLLKGDKYELVLQKGTELGARGFLPLITSRSIVKWDEKKGDKKVERWQKIVKEAAEQSHRAYMPSVYAPMTIRELIAWASDMDYTCIAYEEEAKEGKHRAFADLLQKMDEGNSLLIVFGPEGGLSEQEVTLLKQHGFIACSLGPRILRAETAPLYALSAVSYEWELK